MFYKENLEIKLNSLLLVDDINFVCFSQEHCKDKIGISIK